MVISCQCNSIFSAFMIISNSIIQYSLHSWSFPLVQSNILSITCHFQYYNSIFSALMAISCSIIQYSRHSWSYPAIQFDIPSITSHFLQKNSIFQSPIAHRLRVLLHLYFSPCFFFPSTSYRWCEARSQRDMFILSRHLLLQTCNTVQVSYHQRTLFTVFNNGCPPRSFKMFPCVSQQLV